MSKTRTSVAVIGAGLMGEGIAARLLAGGLTVGIAQHQARAPVDRLLQKGAREFGGIIDLARNCDVILTCLPNSQVVESIFKTVSESLAPETLWIDVTTGEPATTRKLASTLADIGGIFADAPVTGGPEQAAEGKLASLVGCDDEQLPCVTEITHHYSSATYHFGTAGAGHTAKLINNFVSQGTMVLLGQAFRAARTHGVDWTALYNAMSGGAARSGTLEKAVRPALAGDFRGSAFTLRNAEKDLRYALGLFEDHAAIPTALHAELLAYVRAGQGDEFVSQQLAQAPSAANCGTT